MAGPVRSFVKSSSVITGSIFECLLRREVNAVVSSVIEATVCLIVSDVRAGAREYSLAGFYGFERCSRFRNMGRNAINLLCIKDCVDLVDEPMLWLFCRLGRWLARFDF